MKTRQIPVISFINEANRLNKGLERELPSSHDDVEIVNYTSLYYLFEKGLLNQPVGNIPATEMKEIQSRIQADLRTYSRNTAIKKKLERLQESLSGAAIICQQKATQADAKEDPDLLPEMKELMNQRLVGALVDFNAEFLNSEDIAYTHYRAKVKAITGIDAYDLYDQTEEAEIEKQKADAEKQKAYNDADKQKTEKAIADAKAEGEDDYEELTEEETRAASEGRPNPEEPKKYFLPAIAVVEKRRDENVYVLQIDASTFLKDLGILQKFRSLRDEGLNTAEMEKVTEAVQTIIGKKLPFYFRDGLAQIVLKLPTKATLDGYANTLNEAWFRKRPDLVRTNTWFTRSDLNDWFKDKRDEFYANAIAQDQAAKDAKVKSKQKYRRRKVAVDDLKSTPDETPKLTVAVTAKSSTPAQMSPNTFRKILREEVVTTLEQTIQTSATETKRIVYATAEQTQNVVREEVAKVLKAQEDIYGEMLKKSDQPTNENDYNDAPDEIKNDRELLMFRNHLLDAFRQFLKIAEEVSDHKRKPNQETLDKYGEYIEKFAELFPFGIGNVVKILRHAVNAVDAHNQIQNATKESNAFSGYDSLLKLFANELTLNYRSQIKCLTAKGIRTLADNARVRVMHIMTGLKPADLVEYLDNSLRGKLDFLHYAVVKGISTRVLNIPVETLDSRKKWNVQGVFRHSLMLIKSKLYYLYKLDKKQTSLSSEEKLKGDKKARERFAAYGYRLGDASEFKLLSYVAAPEDLNRLLPKEVVHTVEATAPSLPGNNAASSTASMLPAMLITSPVLYRFVGYLKTTKFDNVCVYDDQTRGGQLFIKDENGRHIYFEQDPSNKNGYRYTHGNQQERVQVNSSFNSNGFNCPVFGHVPLAQVETTVTKMFSKSAADRADEKLSAFESQGSSHELLKSLQLRLSLLDRNSSKKTILEKFESALKILANTDASFSGLAVALHGYANQLLIGSKGRYLSDLESFLGISLIKGKVETDITIELLKKLAAKIPEPTWNVKTVQQEKEVRRSTYGMTS
jgi:hypothetical protein